MFLQCRNPENPSKDIKSLIQALKVSKVSQPPMNPMDANINSTVKRSVVVTPEMSGIPKGLIGPPSIVQLKVNGHSCDAVLNCGSQVGLGDMGKKYS